MLQLLLAITLAAVDPAAAHDLADAAVLMLTSGHRMVVRSYEVDGRVLRIVGIDGEPLVMKASLADLEKSRIATEKHRNQVVAQRDAQVAAQRAADERRQQEVERNAAHRAHSRGSANVWIAPEVEPKTDTAAKTDADSDQGPGTAELLPAATADASADEKAKQALVAEYNKLVVEHNKLVDSWNTPMAAHAQLRVQIKEVRDRMSEIKKQLGSSASGDGKS